MALSEGYGRHNRERCHHVCPVTMKVLFTVCILPHLTASLYKSCLYYSGVIVIPMTKWGNCPMTCVHYGDNDITDCRFESKMSEFVILTPDKCLDKVFHWNTFTVKLMKYKGGYKIFFNIFHSGPSPSKEEKQEFHEAQCASSASTTRSGGIIYFGLTAAIVVMIFWSILC